MYPINQISVNWQMLAQTSLFCDNKTVMDMFNGKYTTRKILQDADVM